MMMQKESRTTLDVSPCWSYSNRAIDVSQAQGNATVGLPRPKGKKAGEKKTGCAMDANVFRTRVAPLLDPATLRALRCVDHTWQWIVDQLVEVKGAFGLRGKEKLTAADVRYKHANLSTTPDDWPHFLCACAAGEVADLRWALKTFHAVNVRWHRYGELAMDRVSRVECMEVLVRECFVDVRAAFRGSCENGHLAVAQWLVSAFNLTANDARAGRNRALRYSCMNGHLAVAQWLVSTFNLTADDAQALGNYPFVYTCMHGHMAVVQWLATLLNFTADNAREVVRYALGCSCENGHLAVAQWLASTFSLTAADVRADCNNHSLRWSCEKGRLAVAQWLVSTFNLTADDARANNNFALRGSCQNGHLAVAQWLVSTFNLTARDARAHSNAALRGSCEKGHLAVAQWLVTTFNLTADDAQEAFISEDLRVIRERKHLHVERWLVATFGPQW
jgi:hypothetical protein